MVSNLGRVVVSITSAIARVPALGVEGGLGRMLPGVWIQLQGARLVPIDGSIFSNVDANISTSNPELPTWLVPHVLADTNGELAGAR